MTSANSCAVIQFRVLGRVEVLDGEGHAIDIGGRLARALLAALIIEQGHAITADALIESLWGDDVPASASGTLQSYISRMRKQLAGHAALLYDNAGYRLEIDPEQLDITVFERLADEGRALLDAGDCGAASAALRDAEALWRGDALSEFADLDFARPTAVRLDQRRLTALEDRFDAELRLGRHAAIVDELQEWAEANPLRERLTIQHATALYRCGRQAEALRSIATAGQHLRDHLGIEPSKPLRDIEAAILTHDPALDIVPVVTATAPDGSSLQLELTPEPSSFVGRQAELADVVTAFEEAAQNGRFVVIEGEPGIGKTRLADEFGAVARSRGALVLWGRADEGGAAPGLWPWLTPLRALAEIVEPSPLVTELLTGEPRAMSNQADAAQFERFEAVRELLAAAARRSPIVVMLDDLHWADDTTLDLLTFLAARLDSGIVVVVTMRVLEIGRNDAITEALAAIARRPGSRRLQLRGLPLADTARMLATKGVVSTSVVASIHNRAEGNPFFAIELCRLVGEEGSALDEIPGSVGDVIRRRLAHLPSRPSSCSASPPWSGASSTWACWPGPSDPRWRTCSSISSRPSSCAWSPPTPTIRRCCGSTTP